MPTNATNQRPDEHMPWHTMALDDVIHSLQSSHEGLSPDEVSKRMALYGPNTLPEPLTKSLLSIYLSQFKNAFITLLMIATALSIALGELDDALFIIFALQINAAIGTYQEWQAQSKAHALRLMVQTTATVRRDGAWRTINSHDLVPGDIVRLEAGMRVPAQHRLLNSQSLEVDESLLTGESLPVAKAAKAVLDANTALADQSNMLHTGTVVLRGTGLAITTGTGLRTVVGQVAAAVKSAGDAPPPLLRKMAHFTRVVAMWMVGLIAMIALIEASRGAPLATILMTAIALAVAAIPEGLPVALTVTLAISVTRMSKRNVVVRKLAAVEGLGACTLIATDKTGTLTQNRLSVEMVYLPKAGRIERAAFDVENLRDLATTGVLCNDARLTIAPDGQATIIGDTVDGALLLMAKNIGLQGQQVDDRFNELAKIPYESEKAFAASFYKNPSNDARMAHVKGAPEIVFAMCNTENVSELKSQVESLAADGYRVLALARGDVDGVNADDLTNLECLGLVALIDPLRETAHEAIVKCRSAGVTVRMITGDHPATALSIARALDMAEDLDDVVTGATLEALAGDQTAYDAVVARGRVFARTSPMQKLDIVQAMQRAGHVVAVTGDGVNDASALAAADIGAAMGRSGTDVAREAADMIVTDDDLLSIAAGIEEGRIAYDNVRKVIYLLISTGAAEIMLFMGTILTGLPLPLTPVQLLWLNLVSQGIQDVTLAFEKGEPDVLTRKPRPAHEGIFNRMMIEQVLISGGVVGAAGFALFSSALALGWSAYDASNMLLLMIILFENAHVFNCRSETRSAFKVPLRSNPYLITGVVCVQALHIGAMYTPGLRDVLDIAPVSLHAWVMTAAAAFSIIIIMNLYKMLLRRRVGHAG